MRAAVIPLLFLLLAVGGLRAETSLTLQAATDREFYPEGVRHPVYLALTIGAPATPAGADEGTALRNVVLVLDRSGSMAGAPMQALRAGVAAALDQLAGRDLVAVVVFGSEVETLVEARRRDQLENPGDLLARIEPTGGSALYDALNQGAAQLRRHAGPATSNHLILLTDGPPTKGPRATADFTSLAEVFARERIVVSTIGLGADFNEDLLATLARTGRGNFRYAATPDQLAGALQAELAPTGALLARDVVLTVEFNDDSKKLETHGWAPAEIKDLTATYRFPGLAAGQNLSVLLEAEMENRRFSYTLAKVRLTWTDVADGRTHGLEQNPTVMMDQEMEAVRRSANPGVIRTLAGCVISAGLQKAIEQLDLGDHRRALRELRRARAEALGLNFYLDDTQVQASIGRLDAYLAAVQARGLNQSDRKLLRSGLNHQFTPPVPEDQPPVAKSSSSSSKN